jgi:hypothetical protein
MRGPRARAAHALSVTALLPLVLFQLACGRVEPSPTLGSAGPYPAVPAGPAAPPAGGAPPAARPGRPMGPAPTVSDAAVSSEPPPGGWPVEPAAPGCPSDMARVATVGGDVCIHRFEVFTSLPRSERGPEDGAIRPAAWASVSARAGRVPSKGLTWYQASSVCRGQGWHLCTSQEWEDACDGVPGPGGRVHPVDPRVAPDAACNIRHVRDGVLHASGSAPGCRTPDGVYDLEGNLWEWVDPGQTAADGTPVTDKRGGGYYSADVAPCAQSAIGGHPPTWDGTIGFRCCTAPKDAARGG